MLRHTSSASRKPTSVPTTPTEAPVIMNTRMMAPWVTPMVRRMPMSRPLSFTSMIRPEVMLNAATITMMRQDQEHHVALDLQRVEEGGVALAPVDHEDRAAGRFGDEPAVAVDLVRLVDIDLDGGDVAGAVEIGLRLGQRHEHEGGVVFRHADSRTRPRPCRA